MADPFDALRRLGASRPDRPETGSPAGADPADGVASAVAPDSPADPAFVAALRARLQRELLLSNPSTRAPGGTMTMTSTTTRGSDDAAAAVSGIAAEGSAAAARAAAVALTPYLVVADARAALAFYAEAFGAEPRGEAYEMPDGRVGHAEVSIGGAVLMLADEFPEMGLLGPAARGGASVSLHLAVPDVDAVVSRAVAAGATVEREVADAPYGRTGVVVDPSGHRWMVQTPPAAAPQDAGTPVGKHGDVGYQTLYTPDVERTKAFFGDVLGWRYTGGEAQGGWEASGVVPMTGLMGGAPRPEVQLCFQVDDALAAVRRVRAAGGSAEEPADRPYGLLAECTDDQGMRFQVWQPR